MCGERDREKEKERERRIGKSSIYEEQLHIYKDLCIEKNNREKHHLEKAVPAGSII